jgi:hypothetical protein
MDQDFSHDVAGFVDAFVRDSVQYGVSRAPLYHHLSVTHNGQVLRDSRLSKSRCQAQLAHALLAAPQFVQNLQTLWICKTLANL